MKREVTSVELVLIYFIVFSLLALVGIPLYGSAVIGAGVAIVVMFYFRRKV